MVASYLEIIVLILINAFSAFLIIIVAANSFKEKLFRWFIFMTLILIGWVDFAYLGFLEKNLDLALTAYRVNGVFVSIFIFVAYVFYIQYFLKIKNRWLIWVFTVLSSLFTYLSLFTDEVIQGVIQRDWGNEIVFGRYNIFFSIYTVLFAGILIYYFTTRYLTLLDKEKKKVKYFLFGTIMLILFNVVFNILSPLLFNTAKYQHFGDYSAIIFLAFTAFAILRYKFLGVQVALTSFLVSLIGILLIIDIFALSEGILEQGVKTLILIFFIIISIILLRSVLAEITQRKELAYVNKELDKSKQKYYELTLDQRDVIDVMGHELRTPASVVKINIELMRKQLVYIPEAKRNLFVNYVDRIENSIKAELSIITKLLSSAKLEGKRLEVNLEPVDVVAIIEQVVQGYNLLADEKQLKLLFEKPKVIPQVLADSARFFEVMDNLVSNAIKYTNSGFVKISIEVKAKGVDISVSDSGIGIPQDKIKDLGKKFYRVDNTPNKDHILRPGGIGLGLYVVFGLVKAFGSKLLIHSEVGKGSMFKFFLPFSAENKLKRNS